MFNQNYIELDSINSTNDYINNLNKLYVREGLVVRANFQTEGKGQRSCKWHSDPNKNLLLSVVIEPNIYARNHFLISKIVSLAICDVLFDLGLEPNIKWPNDIIVYDKKISGVLIENKIKGDFITHSIIGVGLNINQCLFQDYCTQATSLSLILNRVFSIKNIEKSLIHFLSKRIEDFRNGYNCHNEYLKLMYLKDNKSSFEHKGVKFTATIRGLSENGSLIIQRGNNTYDTFKIKEIKYIF